MLSRLPRTFDILHKLAIASDKKAFSDSTFDHLKEVIEKTLTKHPSAKKVYRQAKGKNVNIGDLKALNISETDFENVFVATNIFTLRKGGGSVYRFQFEATAAAAKLVCKL